MSLKDLILDIDALEHLASLAVPLPWEKSTEDVPYASKVAFRDAAKPEVILALIARLRKAEQARAQQPIDRAVQFHFVLQQIGQRLGLLAGADLTRDILPALDAALAAQQPSVWDGAEDWESLARALCAEEHGEDACNDLLYEGYPPEPWGDRWMKYEGEARRMIALVRKLARPAADVLADAAELWHALAMLSFECDGVTSTEAPTRETYNRAFAVVNKYREKYGGAARAKGGAEQARAQRPSACAELPEPDDYACVGGVSQPIYTADTVRALARPAADVLADERIWVHFDAAYRKAAETSQPNDWMEAALLAQQVRHAARAKGGA